MFTSKAFAALLLPVTLAPAALLAARGFYGLTLFLVFPFVLGAVTVWIAKPRTGGRAALWGLAASFAAIGVSVLIGMEGLGCLIMFMPLALPLGALGGCMAFHAARSGIGARGAGMLLLIPPASLTWDAKAHPPLYEVRSAIEIAAPAERVWSHVVTFSDLPEPAEWYFHTGLAYPQRARIEGSGGGAIRYCEFSTGAFVEPIETWDEPRLLAFRVTDNPPPMREWSPYATVTPKHLHGYLISKRGQFRLTPLAGNRTLLEGTTWYQHGLWPAPYWRWWSDAIIHRIHLRVLRHIQTLAEAPSAPGKIAP